MLFPTSDQQNLINLCNTYATPVLGSKATSQFVRAIQAPKTWFADTIIKPRLFRSDAFGGVYYPVSLDAFTKGRNHDLAETIATDPDALCTYGCDPWVGLALFANPLRLWTEQSHEIESGDAQL